MYAIQSPLRSQLRLPIACMQVDIGQAAGVIHVWGPVFKDCVDVAVDSIGQIGVADRLNHSVAVYNADGGLVVQWGSGMRAKKHFVI